MRKQYLIVEKSWWQSYIKIYHDGKMISCELYDSISIGDKIEDLKNQGYTLGFSDKEIQEAAERYNYVRENAINPADSNIVKE